MARTERHIATHIMRATGIGHHFTIFKRNEKWVAAYDGATEAEGQTRMEAVQKLNTLLKSRGPT